MIRFLLASTFPRFSLPQPPPVRARSPSRRSRSTPPPRSTRPVHRAAPLDGRCARRGDVGRSGAGFEAIVRPFVQPGIGRLEHPDLAAAVRYQRPGPIGLRVDAGLIPSPVGLANLMLRPQLNPTVSLPASLRAPARRVGAPRTTPRRRYPHGASATVSGARWDARAAVIDTSPLRTRRVFSSTNPPRFDNVIVGGGVTPFVGLRIGGSVTHGGWLKAGESPTITEDRDATIVTVESSSRIATRSCLESGHATRSRPRAASTSPRAGLCRDSRR